MVKLIGSALILSVTVAWGLIGVHKLRKRASLLSMMSSSLELMKSEISDRLTPMPELMERLSMAYKDAVAVFYGTVADNLAEDGVTMNEAWKNAVENTGELLLRDDERSALLELGLSLGKYNADEQGMAIEYTRRKISAFADRASSQRDSESKLHAFLGFAAGVFAVMVLL